MEKITIGIIREGKVPADARTPFSPRQCADITAQFPVQFIVEPSPGRCFTDEEYRQAGITVSPDLSSCQYLMGIKEVPIQQLIPSKTYFFFSHTIKKQPHNRKLLAAILAKKVRMIDYETLADDNHVRLVAFGHFAGIVGAHNGMMTYGNRTQLFQLPQMIQFGEYKHAKEAYKTLQLPPMKIVVTGTGRVSSGAVEVLNLMGIRQLTPQQFLEQSFDEPVFTQVDCDDYVVHNQLQTFVSKTDYYQHPENYSMRFAPYYQQADLLINGIYWDKRYPPFFSPDEMARPDFRIRVIADITCDIAPDSSIPSTLDASTIAQPVYGYDPHTRSMVAPYQPQTIDVMAIDNLPNEMPRDASRSFGAQFIQHILPHLFHPHTSTVLSRATIAQDGMLQPNYTYLADYVAAAEYVG